MTREEAIAQLKMDRDLANFNPMTGEEEPMNEDCRKSVEALDMAINALEQQPCEDTISRQAALDMASTIQTDDSSGNEILDVVEVDDIKALPSAQPEPAIPLQWIEAQIKWLKSLDNAFSTLTAGQISAMVNKWKDEQDG